ncbi:hypothetical protein ROHU_019407 [Labeo rohita]|uniref:Uncharacterized protein n=1 Tax=Labeo rohita TaxID=84645 RepID=A0A498NDY5_LABRO|nr:hypothetical protein ROHU_019407 [Labeo rohita]
MPSEVTLHTRQQTGLSLPVQQSRGSLRSQWGPSTRYIIARGILPPGAAEPQLPSEATRVPPSIDSNILAYPASDGASPSAAAEPQLPSVAVWALHLPIELRCILGSGRGPPSRCSRAAGSLRSQREPSSEASNRSSSPAARGTRLPVRHRSPSFDICHHVPPLATCRARQSDLEPQLPSSSAWALQVALPPP